MPKHKQEEIKNLLTNMKGEAARARGPQKAEQKPSGHSTKGDLLHRQLDLSPYKEHKAWPGNAYLLVGNSYNMEHPSSDSAYNKRRARNVTQLFEHYNGKHYVSVEDALCYAPFVDTLSRFEFDWLRREAPTSQVGPAYDGQGKRLPASFAVWRSEAQHLALKHGYSQQKAAAPKQRKQLVGAK
ncbi:MAG: hypothetical protein JSS83_24890 [Cyanobacteria bacterium SZAS LIN-3]|nr:hypothetical protein [Cyanobacteria bacterium SZAS LIN-3]